MSKYNCTMSDLAEYIGNLNLSILIDSNCTNSSVGRRTYDYCSYKVKIEKILTDESIPIKIDTFLRTDNSIDVAILIPKFNFKIWTSELSNSSFLKGATPMFECYSEQAFVNITIPSETTIDSFRDFKKQLDCVINVVYKTLFDNINALRNDKWIFSDTAFKFNIEVNYN